MRNRNGAVFRVTPARYLLLATLHLFLLVPFEYHAVHYSADLEKFFLMMNHVSPSEPGDGVIFAQENCLLRTNLFAHPAVDAADHVDVEFLREFFDFGEGVARGNLAGNNFDRPWRTNEFTKLTCHTAHAAARVAHQGRRATIVIRQVSVPFLLGILHGYFGPSEQHVLEMFERDSQTGGDGGQIQSLAPVQFRPWNGDGNQDLIWKPGIQD